MIFISYLIILLLAVFVLLLVFLAVQLYQMGKMRDSINELKSEVQGLKTKSLENAGSPSNLWGNITVVQAPVPPVAPSPSHKPASYTPQPNRTPATPDEKSTSKHEDNYSSIKNEVIKIGRAHV